MHGLIYPIHSSFSYSYSYYVASNDVPLHSYVCILLSSCQNPSL